MSRVESIENERDFSSDFEARRPIRDGDLRDVVRTVDRRCRTDEFGSHEDIDRVHAARKKRE